MFAAWQVGAASDEAAVPQKAEVNTPPSLTPAADRKGHRLRKLVTIALVVGAGVAARVAMSGTRNLLKPCFGRVSGRLCR